MDALELARWQFGITTVYHFVLVPLTLGLSSSAKTGTVRDAARNAEAHLDYIDFLLDRRRWLAGPAFGLADIAAAAQLSVADYLGGVEWDGHEPAKIWYSALKSRPAFRPLLGERMEGLPPPLHYDKLDF